MLSVCCLGLGLTRRIARQVGSYAVFVVYVEYSWKHLQKVVGCITFNQ